MKNKQLTKTDNYTRRLVLSVILVLGMFFSMNAQKKIEVTGVVTSAVDNLPIPGVAIIIKGTNIGTVTDFDGKYTINAKLGDILEFKALGFSNQSQKVRGATLDVKIEEDIETLGETIVIGYGKVQKKEVTGAVAQVKAAEIENFVTADLASALQGQIAGVNINPDGSEPGAPSSISIRGVSSLSGTNNPLFIVDGIPFDEDPNLNPNEVETIDVLKDAASAAIYGTRGAGGVIIITTKRGKEGKNTIDFDATVGFQNVPSGNFVETADVTEQIFIDTVTRNNNEVNSGQTVGASIGDATGFRLNLLNDTNVVDDALNDGALFQRYNIRFSGGSKGVNYSIVGGYLRQEGIVQGSVLDRYNMRTNVRIKKNKWSINNGFGFTIDDRDIVSANLISSAISFEPFSPSLEDVTNIPLPGPARTSSLRILRALAGINEENRYRFSANNQIKYQLTKSLSLTNLIGFSFTQLSRTRASADIDIPQLNRPDGLSRNLGSVAESSIRNINVNWNGGFDYNKKIGKHKIKGTLLASIQEEKAISFAVSTTELADNGLTTLSNATGETVATSETQLASIPGNFVNPDDIVRRLGIIGRVLYDYDKKYLINISARRDGSSRFGPDFRFNTFPSVSAAWNVSEEEFWAPYKKYVTDFKIRASRGTTGSDRFFQNTGLTNNIFSFLPGQAPGLGVAVGQLSNRDVKWEVTKQFNFGFDISLFKKAVTITADYYTTEKEDLLLPITNPPSSGVDASGNPNFSPRTVVNIGNLENSGIEYAINYRGKAGDFNWNIGGTFTTNQNTVTKLNGDVRIQQTGGSPELFNAGGTQRITHLVRGFDPGAFLLFRTDGVINNQQELDEYLATTDDTGIRGEEATLGDLKYVDTNGDGIINQDDREVRGSGLPEFEAGLNVTLGYKGFSLTTNWFGSFGNEVLNGSRAVAFNDARNRDLVFQFTEQNPDAVIPRFNGRGGQNVNFAGNTDLFLEDGTFVRLRNIILNYKLPKPVLKGLGLSAASVFVSGQNLVTFTEYSGFDPGVGGNNIARRGVDLSRFPLAQTYNLGVKLKF